MMLARETDEVLTMAAKNATTGCGGRYSNHCQTAKTEGVNSGVPVATTLGT